MDNLRAVSTPRPPSFASPPNRAAASPSPRTPLRSPPSAAAPSRLHKLPVVRRHRPTPSPTTRHGPRHRHRGRRSSHHRHRPPPPPPPPSRLPPPAATGRPSNPAGARSRAARRWRPVEARATMGTAEVPWRLGASSPPPGVADHRSRRRRRLTRLRHHHRRSPPAIPSNPADLAGSAPPRPDSSRPPGVGWRRTRRAVLASATLQRRFGARVKEGGRRAAAPASPPSLRGGET